MVQSCIYIYFQAIYVKLFVHDIIVLDTAVLYCARKKKYLIIKKDMWYKNFARNSKDGYQM